MSRCLRKVTFDGLFTAAVPVAVLAAVSPIFAAAVLGKAPELHAPAFEAAVARVAQISVGHDGRALPTNVKALETLPR